MDILATRRDGVLVLELNRPGKKNALTSAMYLALADALQVAAGDEAVRALLLHGQDGCFSAGHDLEDFLREPPLADDSPVLRFLGALNTCPKPIVAAVSGLAVGVGATLLLHCDLVYAAEGSRFSFPFVRLGLCPEAASTLLLPWLCGYQRAAEKLMLGEPFDAGEAQQMGLVNQIVPAPALVALAMERAQRLSALPPQALQACKRLMKRAPEAARHMADESALFRRLLAEPEAQQALQAFTAKRG